MSERMRFEGVEARIGNNEKLERLVLAAAEQINQEAEKEYGLKGLVEPDGSLAMAGYAKINGGIYKQKQMDKFAEEVADAEAAHSTAFRMDRGTPEYLKTIADWKERTKNSKAHKVEQAIMLLFYKVLKNEFMVVRSAVYDDYKGGVDNLLVNKKTGQVICAIDDFHEGSMDRKKAEKSQRVAKNGGTTMEFGLAVKDGKVVRAKLEYLPVFYLGITSEKFEELIRNMSSDLNAPVSPKEQQIFLEFMELLEAQRDQMEAMDLRPQIKGNVEGLKTMLAKMKIMTENLKPLAQAA